MLLAIEVDGITHLDEKVMLKDEIRQEEIEVFGISFLRFDALLVVNKVEAAIWEIRDWIIEFEEKSGVNENVLRKRKELENPKSKKRL